MLKKIFLPFFVVQFIISSLSAQNKTIDSLLALLKKDKPDTGKVIHLNKLCWEYKSIGNFADAFYHGNAALQLAEQLNFKKGIATAYNSIGLIYYHQGNYDKALGNYFASLKIREETGDKKGIASSYNNIGVIYYRQGNYDKALENHYASLKISEETGDKKGIASSYNNIGLIYDNQGNYDKALENHYASLKLQEETGDKQGIAASYNNIGDGYKHKGKPDVALENYFASLKIFEEIGDQQGIALSYICIANGYTDKSDYSNATVWLQKGLMIAKEIGAMQLLLDGYKGLTEVNEKMNDYHNAYKNYQLYSRVKDSIFNEESINRAVQLQMTYEFEKKEALAKAKQDKKDVLAMADIKKRKIITSSVIIILIMLIALVILLLRQQRGRRKRDEIVFEHKQEISEKENALLRSEKQRVEEELISSKKILYNYMENMLKKNEILEQFSVEIEKLRNLKSGELYEEKMEHLNSLNKAIILTEDDWHKFKELFEQVYKDFFVRLKEKLPDLTPAETRLICLTKLKLDTRQMAGILGVSIDTIKKTRYRLRKKLGLSEENSIDDIAVSI